VGRWPAVPSATTWIASKPSFGTTSRDTGVSVTRMGDNITLNMPGNITFKSDSSELDPSFYKVLKFGQHRRQEVQQDCSRGGRPY